MRVQMVCVTPARRRYTRYINGRPQLTVDVPPGQRLPTEQEVENLRVGYDKPIVDLTPPEPEAA